jgi:hypothetical protein
MGRPDYTRSIAEVEMLNIGKGIFSASARPPSLTRVSDANNGLESSLSRGKGPTAPIASEVQPQYLSHVNDLTFFIAKVRNEGPHSILTFSKNYLDRAQNPKIGQLEANSDRDFALQFAVYAWIIARHAFNLRINSAVNTARLGSGLIEQ